MTSTTTDYFDAIGQKITPGDYVISIRDGTGAKPRMALKFSPSKVSISCSWGTSQSYMDACSLVVITTNMEALRAAGNADVTSRMDDLQSKFASMVEHTAPVAKPVPIRWVVIAHSTGSAYSDERIQYVSVHQVQGASQSAYLEGNNEAFALSQAESLQTTYTMNRTADNSNSGYYARYKAGNHWPYGNNGWKEHLFAHKTMVEIGLDNVELNKLIPVDVFNSMVPPTHRITKV